MGIVKKLTFPTVLKKISSKVNWSIKKLRGRDMVGWTEEEMKSSRQLWEASTGQNQKRQNAFVVCSLIHQRTSTAIVNPVL